MAKTCSMCGSAALETAIDPGAMPLTRIRTAPGRDSEPRYPMATLLCPVCGLLQLADPLPPEVLYVETDVLTTTHQIQDNVPDEISTVLNFTDARSVLEIACNDGRFLDALTRAGVELVVGVEPSRQASAAAAAAGFTVHPCLFDGAAARRIAQEHGRFETVVARQLLEHIADLDGFFDAIEQVIEERGFVFFEIPAVREPVAMGDLSVLWEEHVNYFVPETIQALLERQGYEVVAERIYNRGGGTYLVVGRRTGRGRDPAHVWPSPARFLAEARAFAGRVAEYRALMHDTLGRARANGWTVVLYGAGHRGCTVVDGLGIGDLIDQVIDDRPQVAGGYLPGTDLQIRGRAVLAELAERGAEQGGFLVLLAVSNENEVKVKRALRAMGLVARSGDPARLAFASILSPRDIHGELAAVRDMLSR